MPLARNEGEDDKEGYFTARVRTRSKTAERGAAAKCGSRECEKAPSAGGCSRWVNTREEWCCRRPSLADNAAADSQNPSVRQEFWSGFPGYSCHTPLVCSYKYPLRNQSEPRRTGRAKMNPCIHECISAQSGPPEGTGRGAKSPRSALRKVTRPPPEAARRGCSTFNTTYLSA